MGLAANISDLPTGGTSQAIHRVISVAESNIGKQSTVYFASGGEPTAFFSTTISGGTALLKLGGAGSKLCSIIDNISSCFNLTKEELASVCKVQSRKTLYNWMDGRQPRALTMDRLFDLLMIASAWKQNNFPNDYESLHQASLQGVSILDMLKSDTLNREKILFAGSRLALANSGSTLLKDPFA